MAKIEIKHTGREGKDDWTRSSAAGFNDCPGAQYPDKVGARIDAEKKARVMYDFDAAGDDELTFKAGEIVIMLDGSNDYWRQGSNYRGEGLFPANYVTVDLDKWAHRKRLVDSHLINCDTKDRSLLQNLERQIEEDNVIHTTEEDELSGFSQDETQFLKQTILRLSVNKYSSIEMPLPFRNNPTIQLPINQGLAYNRTKKKIDQLKAKNPNMLHLATEKMAQNICEYPLKFVPVPSWARNPQPGKAYWIPIMIIPSKGKVRIVFDAVAKSDGCCLNDAFLQGPDCNNALRAVLLRFRLCPVVYTADIKNRLHSSFMQIKPYIKDSR